MSNFFHKQKIQIQKALFLCILQLCPKYTFFVYNYLYSRYIGTLLAKYQCLFGQCDNVTSMFSYNTWRSSYVLNSLERMTKLFTLLKRIRLIWLS